MIPPDTGLLNETVVNFDTPEEDNIQSNDDRVQQPDYTSRALSTRGNKWSPEISGVRRLKTFAHALKPENPPFDPAVTREVKRFCKP